MKPRSHKSGFTLVELLVVITIIGILIALLLPAVQAAREAARQTQCRNNLKELALGCLNHEQLYKFYPTGGWGCAWVGDPDQGFDKHQPGGWMYNVLPFTEQNALHEMGAGLGDGADSGNPNHSAKCAALTTVMCTPLAVLCCPTRRAAVAYPVPHTAALYNANAPTLLPKKDYAANSGDNAPPWSDNGPPTIAQFATYTASSWTTYNLNHDGVIFGCSMIQTRDITDGTTNTILLGEAYADPDYYSTSGDTGSGNTGDAQSWDLGYDMDNVRWVATGNYPTNSPAKWTATLFQQDQPGVVNAFIFGSAHSNGCFFAFCDGSVQMLSYSMDGDTFCRLGVRNDGLTIDGKKF